MRPLATYRVQLHPDFGFAAAADLASYLAALGVSHLYSSPYLQAVPGSQHGYDVVDPTRVSAELGGPDGHASLCRTLAERGLGQVLDIVPNHMAVHGANPWWWDVLEHGPGSRCAQFFDVDWAPGASRENVILLPVLGDHYGRVLEAGRIRLRRDGTTLRVAYEDNVFPLAPRSLERVLRDAAEASGHAELLALADGAAEVRTVEPAESLETEQWREQSRRTSESLARLLDADAEARQALDATLARVNEDPDSLDALLEEQYYRLAFWRMASRELDYRRFFDINTLVGVCVEREEVFAATHGRVIEWLEQGLLDGVRIDHIDGLYDPFEYLGRLRRAAPHAWIIIEKILEPGERVPTSWPVDGTTGYDFVNVASGLFVDTTAERELTALYKNLTGEPTEYAELVREKKHLVLDELFGSDVNQLTALLSTVCERHRRYRDYTRRDLADAIKETIACFPVYRTYVRAGERSERSIAETDVRYVQMAIEAAKAHRDELDPALFELIRDLLLLRIEGDAERRFAMRMQQVTGPAMAKGVEDTAFYCYNRFIALNEVGGMPARFGVPVEAFHEWARETQRDHPETMLATSTHDTKRAEDVRMRLALLSEIPGRWSEAATRWARMNQAHKHDGWPDRNAEYLLYQTLVGAWPIGFDRVWPYAEKAAREAKQHTSWTRPSPRYETALAEFIEAVMDDAEFMADLEAFVKPLIEPGRVNSLALTLIKLTSPGVPDIYQGTELWDSSLVDPDNRRPVDYDARRRLLEALDEDRGREAASTGEDDGRAKLWLIRRALGLRRERADAFGTDGAYDPLPVRGAKAAHVVAFARGGVTASIAPRLVLGMGGDWQDTVVELPDGRWRNVLSGRDRRATELAGGSVPLEALLADFPVALLARQR